MLLLRLGGERYGIDSEKIDQILRIPPITPLPLAAPVVSGVVVLGGKMVTVVDLGKLLGVAPVDRDDDRSRIVTVEVQGEQVALMVDEVLDAMTVEEDAMESNRDAEEAVVGFYKSPEGLVQVLSVDRLLPKEGIERFEPLEVEAHEGEEATEKTVATDATHRYLFFRGGEERFAVDIDLVAELIFVPEVITPLAGSDPVVMGAITLRDEVIDTIDFNRLFGFAPISPDRHEARLMILKEMSKKVAFCVEGVEEIRDVSTKELESVVSEQSDTLEALCKCGEGIVSIISSSYFRELIDRYCVSESEEIRDRPSHEEDATMKELAVFAIGKEEYAFDIEGVQEIIAWQEVTPLPEGDPYVEGVINLRGTIVPVINLPEKIGYESHITDKSKIVVCQVGGEKVGFLVDDVNDIMFVEDRHVMVSRNPDRLVQSTISLDGGKRVILELRIEKIVSAETVQQIKEEAA